MKVLKESIRNYFESDGDSSVKAALYYLICQVLVKGMTFLTTPIFARLLSKNDYGVTSNFFSWQMLLMTFVTLHLNVTINKSKFDFREDNDSYLGTILLLSNVSTMLVWGVVELNSVFFCSLFSLNMFYIRIMFLYIIFQTAFDYQQIQYRINNRYKLFVLYTILSSASSAALSVILTIFMADKLEGRLLGFFIPSVIIDIIIYANILKKIKQIKYEYIKYSLAMAIPLIPSALSATILSTSDRTMITAICGSEETAMYSLAYSVSALASIVWTSLNQAWTPWMYDRLHENNFDTVRQYSKRFSLLYSAIILMFMLVCPEIVYVMGGDAYMASLGVMPPVVLGMVFQFYYAFYFNTEYFYGETYIISLGTTISAIVNLVLNFIFIPKYGYIAAAYTTLIGYAVMWLYHYLIVRYKLKKSDIFDNTFFATNIVTLGIVQIFIYFIYDYVYIRFSVLLLFGAVLCVYGYKNKEIVLKIIKKVTHRS